MPSGAKKRKALKKKKEEETIGANTDNKRFTGHDERESDGNLSSPGSQGNEEFETKDHPSAALLSGLEKDTGIEKRVDEVVTKGDREKGVNAIAFEREENREDTTKVASQEATGNLILETSLAVDSVSNAVISDKNKQVESSSGSNAPTKKSDEYEEKPRIKEAEEGNIVKLSGSAAETSREVKSVREYELPECSEDKSLLTSGPPAVRTPAVRTSWLSCCGLFDVMSGSER